ncbi:Cysteine-rich receptor-like protein kinase 11 [Ananas comosus]|uniref:non-specific serine/threonine protein kinase n=1 Tax=Ananas comosus TaxID=4615 RepID=A0A199W979_ANACO|nr:Cysteine-rich receptor-like protein kinase 11 [Ananas comosus]
MGAPDGGAPGHSTSGGAGRPEVRRRRTEPPTPLRFGAFQQSPAAMRRPGLVGAGRGRRRGSRWWPSLRRRAAAMPGSEGGPRSARTAQRRRQGAPAAAGGAQGWPGSGAVVAGRSAETSAAVGKRRQGSHTRATQLRPGWCPWGRRRLRRLRRRTATVGVGGDGAGGGARVGAHLTRGLAGSGWCWFTKSDLFRRKLMDSPRPTSTNGSAIRLAQIDSLKPLSNSDLPLVDLATIQAATNSFAKDNKLGEGGFGPVYRVMSLAHHGVLSGGVEIAVQRLSTKSRQGTVEFRNEVELIAKLQHRNLVRLLGCCVERDEKLLTYEYLLNRSLDAFLFGESDSSKHNQLDWKRRHHIIMGIARGLLYLHDDSVPKVKLTLFFLYLLVISDA